MEGKQRQVYQVIIIVDTNIIFSGLLNPDGKIGDLLLNSSNSFEFFSPSFLLDELKKHHNKLRKISTLPDKDLEFLKRMLISKIELIDLENIPPQNWNKATKLVEDIDEFDTPFIALSIALNAPLWTGDKKLIKGLRKKKFDLLLDTDSIFSIRNSI